MIDIHCHILPGLDDGAQTMEDALGMATAAGKDGISGIVATPHLFRSGFGNGDFEEIEEKRKILKARLKESQIDVKIFPGAEVHISHNLLDEIRKNRKYLVLNRSSYLLVEFPTDHIFSGVKSLFFELMSDGVTPIIAHPERNTVFMRHPELLSDFVRMGALAQANSGSFLGVYGTNVQMTAVKFLELNLFHFMGSDGHRVGFIKSGLSEALRVVSRIVGEKEGRALVDQNPRAVLVDEVLPYLPDPIDPRSRRKSVRIKIPSFFKKKE